MSNKVIPGILESSWEEIEKKIQILKAFTDRIHIDFIDESFSQNTTFLDPAPFSKYGGELYLEAHLQIKEPINLLDSLSKSGFKKLIGNVERMSSQEEFVAKGELLGEVGLGLNLATPLNAIKVPFEDLDLVHLLTISANETGLSFDPSSLSKIKELRSKTSLPIEVDGGINDLTIIKAKDAGANIFVSTSFISNSPDPEAAFKAISGLV